MWPPTLPDLKLDAGIDPTDTRDDAVLAVQLAAAIDFVQRTHLGRYEFDPLFGVSGLPTPGHEMELGTVRLAVRWAARRRSPDGTFAMGDVGTSTIPAFDADIERQLEVGLYAGSMIV